MSKAVSSTPSNEPAQLWEVKAEPGYANAELDGARVLLIHTVAVGVVDGIILTGPYTGRRWRFLSKHLKEVARV